MYDRKQYLNALIRLKDNGRVKIITGLRRSGKSVLLFDLFMNHLLKEGIPRDHIVDIALDDFSNLKYRNPMELDRYVRNRIHEDGQKY